MSDILMELHTHYKAVRARLNGEPPKPPPPLPPLPPLEYLATLPPINYLEGLCCPPSTKEMVLPILKKHRMVWRNATLDKRDAAHILLRSQIYVVLNATGWSLPRIGALCGGRDHTTVLNSIKRFVKSYLTDEERALCKELDLKEVQYCYWKMELTEKWERPND